MKIKYTVIVTASNEARLAAECVDSILNPSYKNNLKYMELILVCPDNETFTAVSKVVMKYSFKEFIYLKDEKRGKPTALNMGIDKARGKYIICTDGDVYVGKQAITKLIEPFNKKEVGLVSGKPVSLDNRKKMWGYVSHMMCSAADDKRSKLQQKNKPYFASGYLMAFRNINGLSLPSDVLVDDAWITLEFINKDYKVKYVDDAEVYVRFPKNYKDWKRQKIRSVGGYKVLDKYFDKKAKLVRSIKDELTYFFYPISYAKGFKEYFFSFRYYFIRLRLWGSIWWKFKIKRDYEINTTWKRVESTK